VLSPLLLLLLQEISGCNAVTHPCPGDIATASSRVSPYSPSLDEASAATADERRPRVWVDPAADDGQQTPGVAGVGGHGATGAAGPGPVCASCQRVVADRYYLAALGVAWHVGCLTCQHCRRPLDSQLTCFVRDGAVYCRQDYYR